MRLATVLGHRRVGAFSITAGFTAATGWADSHIHRDGLLSDSDPAGVYVHTRLTAGFGGAAWVLSRHLRACRIQGRRHGPARVFSTAVCICDEDCRNQRAFDEVGDRLHGGVDGHFCPSEKLRAAKRCKGAGRQVPITASCAARVKDGERRQWPPPGSNAPAVRREKYDVLVFFA